MTAPMRSFRVSDDEWQQWQAAAEARGLDRSEWVRRVVQAAAEREVPKHAAKVLDTTIRHLVDVREKHVDNWDALLVYLERAGRAVARGDVPAARCAMAGLGPTERALTGSTTHTDAVLAALDGVK